MSTTFETVKVCTFVPSVMVKVELVYGDKSMGAPLASVGEKYTVVENA